VDGISNDTPDELLKPSTKDTHAGELDSASQVGVESFDELGKHGREREGAKALHERASGS
jgi:hypothetical protein